MNIFEYPYIIITILILSFLILGGVGLYFALQGIKVAKGIEEKEISSVSKLESHFEKLKRMRMDRNLIYISISLENVRSTYSDGKAWDIFSRIEPIILKWFSVDENSLVAAYDGKNFIALNTFGENKTKETIFNCQEEIKKCLLQHEALTIVDFEFGSYSQIATLVTFDEAINRAKQACTIAENEKITHVEWNSDMGKALEQKIKIENNIESEIDNNRFFLVYQPVLDAKTKKIVGAEVLARLNSETDGVLNPGSFLSAVDSVGINDKFDYYIFEKNCKWISNNKEEREGYKYTINFSRTTICDPDFANRITEIIEKYQLKYSVVAIEVLEDKEIVGEAKKIMINNLADLKSKGITILLDDFGSGFTAFSDLQSLDISTVKVDKSIIGNATTESGFILLKNIIRTANDLGYKTVCEGIETKEHEEAAIKAGCDFLQGFYYFKPMPVAQLEACLKGEKL